MSRPDLTAAGALLALSDPKSSADRIGTALALLESSAAEMQKEVLAAADAYGRELLPSAVPHGHEGLKERLEQRVREVVVLYGRIADARTRLVAARADEVVSGYRSRADAEWNRGLRKVDPDEDEHYRSQARGR